MSRRVLAEATRGSGVYDLVIGPIQFQVTLEAGGDLSLMMVLSAEEGLHGDSVTIDGEHLLPLRLNHLLGMFGDTIDTAIARCPRAVDAFLRTTLVVETATGSRTILAGSSLDEALCDGTLLRPVETEDLGETEVCLRLETGRSWTLIEGWPELRRDLFARYEEIAALRIEEAFEDLVRPPEFWSYRDSDGALLGLFVSWEDAPSHEMIDKALQMGGETCLDIAYCSDRARFLPLWPGVAPSPGEMSEVVAHHDVWACHAEVSGILQQVVHVDLMPLSVPMETVIESQR